MEKRTRKPGKSWTHCRGIQEQFVEKILSGEKTTTIRPDAKNMQAGDRIQFFTGWRKLGALYQVTVDVRFSPYEIKLYEYGAKFSDMPVWTKCGALDKFAQSDGFDSFDDMLAFFQNAYPRKIGPYWTFEGKVITFNNPRIEAK